MADWINVGEDIAYDWYEVRCHFEMDNRLKVYLNGLKDETHQFCIDFGKVFLYKAIDEGWSLNPFEYEGNSQARPSIRDSVLVELIDSRLKAMIKKKSSYQFYHYQVLGINFGIDVISENIPNISKVI